MTDAIAAVAETVVSNAENSIPSAQTQATPDQSQIDRFEKVMNQNVDGLPPVIKLDQTEGSRAARLDAFENQLNQHGVVSPGDKILNSMAAPFMSAVKDYDRVTDWLSTTDVVKGMNKNKDYADLEIKQSVIKTADEQNGLPNVEPESSLESQARWALQEMRESHSRLLDFQRASTNITVITNGLSKLSNSFQTLMKNQ